ncbi:MAG: hypothetical protein J7J32_06660, partial [Candidatus Atribacteria bacterium]|nr:hypothetical protein [Candidatus Atribacteria bacterium]MCD6349973.1 hypothetical protein [Candidatus Atribacteria bacterium]
MLKLFLKQDLILTKGSYFHSTKGTVITRRSIGQDPGGDLEYCFETTEKLYNAKQIRNEEGWQKLYLEEQPLYAQEV